MATALAPMRPAMVIHFLMPGGSEYIVSLTTTCFPDSPLALPFSIIFRMGLSVQAAVPSVVLMSPEVMLTTCSMIWFVLWERSAQQLRIVVVEMNALWPTVAFQICCCRRRRRGSWLVSRTRRVEFSAVCRWGRSEAAAAASLVCLSS